MSSLTTWYKMTLQRYNRRVADAERLSNFIKKPNNSLVSKNVNNVKEDIMISAINGKFALLNVVLCFSCISFPVALSSNEEIQDLPSVENTPDLLAVILSGIQHYDTLIQSGEGDVNYRRTQTVKPEFDEARQFHLTFDGHKTRMDLTLYRLGQSKDTETSTIILDGKSMWSIHEDGRFLYTTQPSIFFSEWDPRAILTWGNPLTWSNPWNISGLDEYLEHGNFKVKNQQNLGKIRCYLLENSKEERVWIAPEQGFRCLKYEHKYRSRTSDPNNNPSLKKGTPIVARKRVSYHKCGEAWFPKQSIRDSISIDENGQEHIIMRIEHETQNFRCNHTILEKTFTVEIPEQTKIYVPELDMELSKTELFNRYNLE